ncbi:MAG: glycogen/starch/alpha-glucan phosphorylase [Myxococcota bacterium]
MVSLSESAPPAADRVDVRTGFTVEAIKQAVRDNLFYVLARFPEVATQNDKYMALAYTIRDRMLERWVKTGHTYYEKQSRTVCYLSAEFLLGPHLGNNLLNLGLTQNTRQAVAELGVDLDALVEQEAEPGLGNGGLGRLAACYLESLATLQIPCIGYGIRYEFGIFDQTIRDGWQVEQSDTWLHLGNPWEVPRPEITFTVKLGGRTEHWVDPNGRYRVRWIPKREVLGVAYDTPILGYRVGNCNLLRLWKAEAHQRFDFQAFNVGDYYGAVDDMVVSENISKVLYPNDEPLEGKRLRLEQQYFFVTCSLQDMIRLQFQLNDELDGFHRKFAVQLNDTHPAIAVAELMRLLVDEHFFEWDHAWDITTRTMAYTNHTLLPEALEKWPLGLFQSVLPRHLEIIYEINQRFIDEVRGRFPGDDDRIRRMSIIDEEGSRSVRMAHLACVGSHAINGVAALHTELLKNSVLRDFFELWPEKFSNKTNGVTPRRFVALSNPDLTELVSKRIGDGFIRDYSEIRKLEAFADDPAFQHEWRAVKIADKEHLAKIIQERTGFVTDPTSIFDILVKRIHEYKRQHLCVLHAIALYNRMKSDPNYDPPARTVIFGGKAAPSYFMAKLIIKLVNAVGEVVNRDPDVRDRLKVIFVPGYSVKLAQHIYPAADLSEQISMAGKEASGTGNMKFAMNGALTIGTLDGANLEIRQEVGAENFFLFGLTTDEVQQRKAEGYRPHDVYEGNPELKAVIDRISFGDFSGGDRELFKPLVQNLLHHDPYLVLADFQSYLDCQEEVAKAWRDPVRWTRMSILNSARMGKFSSDRSIQDYCRDIWKVEPMPVPIPD